MSWEGILILCLKGAAVAALVLLNGFFVAAEFALVKVRDTQLDMLIAKGQWRARVAQRVHRNLDAALSACQLGITLASLGLGWVGEPIFSALLQPLWPWVGLDGAGHAHVRHTASVVVGFSAITFLHICAGELAPKSLAIQKPLWVSLWAAGPLEWFHRLSYPFIWVLNHASWWLLARVGLHPVSEAEMAHSEEELRLLFSAAQRRAGGTELGRNIVLNAFELRHRIAREVMRPRRAIVGLNTEAAINECLETAEKTHYSRFPLCEGGDLDKTIGVVHVKDLYLWRHRAARGADLRPVARKVVYVPETAPLERLLQLLLERRLHLAVVVDEYGGTVGMVTLENILEELVGQIQDEFDQEKPLVVSTGENAWELQGALPLHQFADLVGLPIADEGITTVSGWVTRRFGRFPQVRENLEFGPYVLQVDETDGTLVTRLTLTKRPQPPSPQPTEEK
jgi:CBS domain containing-hemolysin-like protein